MSKVGIGGAPTRATTFPADAAGRKACPVASGVMDYFPDALVAIAHVSHAGNEQHNPGQPLHWNRGKSADESDALMRHFLERGTIDTDGIRHSAKMAWRALALLQKEMEAAKTVATIEVVMPGVILDPPARTCVPSAYSEDVPFRCPQDGQRDCCESLSPVLRNNNRLWCTKIAQGTDSSFAKTGVVTSPKG